LEIIRGRVWKFGNDVNTDLIAPGRYMNSPIEELKKRALETVNPRFAIEVKPGDIVVAGANFGCGSSREEAPKVLKALGVGAVLAESFSRIFFRNSIAVGLPVAVCHGVFAALEEGDELEFDLNSGKVINITSKQTLISEPLSAEMKEVLSRGGILPMLKEIARRETGSN
jgi:3-isopropylmalate/(R)-2-methylmalate dehydratase small subunit